MPDILRPVAARLAGIVVGALAAWLATKFGLMLSEQSKQALANGIIELIAIFLGAYALTHKAVSVKTNPADAATPTLADHGKVEQERLKQ